MKFNREQRGKLACFTQLPEHIQDTIKKIATEYCCPIFICGSYNGGYYDEETSDLDIKLCLIPENAHQLRLDINQQFGGKTLIDTTFFVLPLNSKTGEAYIKKFFLYEI